jgi:Xaa-Pro aminopeptidase
MTVATSARADRLVDQLAERELDAIIVTNLLNVRYLTGFTGSNGVAIVSPDMRVFITDFRYVEQAQNQVPDFELARGKQDLLSDVVKRLSGRVGFDDTHVTVRQYERLQELVPEGVELVGAGGAIEELRAVKDSEELQHIRDAAELSDRVFQYLSSGPIVGRTEREVAVDLEHWMRLHGAERPSFPSIVASGPHGALPHAVPRDETIAADTLITFDLGCVVDGYCSDCTRTFATGEISDEMREVYKLVLSAQLSALEAVRPGAENRAVDAAAREPIAAAGHGDHFGHGLGHGVGLDIHEAPRLAQTVEGSLVAGNVVTIEPGVYIPGKFGVRIEDLVAVTDDGAEIFTHFPKDLITLGS